MVLVVHFHDSNRDSRARIFHGGDDIEIFPPMTERGFFGLRPLHEALKERFGEVTYLGRAVETAIDQDSDKGNLS